MRSIAVSVFKQRCLHLLDEVRQTGVPVRITKRGVPMADVVPVPRAGSAGWQGAMRGTVEFTGDIVSPAAPDGEWDALRR